MTEERARRLAREKNAARLPGQPVWTAYRTDPPDGRDWDVGTVEVRDVAPALPVRDFGEI